MSSSVSSEHAFSQGGITITKLRSCLKGDIVEALLCLKCAIKNDILMRELAPSSMLEECEQEADDGNDTKDFSWDELVVEDDGDSNDGIFDSD